MFFVKRTQIFDKAKYGYQIALISREASLAYFKVKMMVCLGWFLLVTFSHKLITAFIEGLR